MNIKESFKSKINNNITYLTFFLVIISVFTIYIATSQSKFVLEKELAFDLEIVENEEWNKRTLITGIEFNEKILSSGATKVVFGEKDNYLHEIENIEGIDIAIENKEKAFKKSDIELYVIANSDNETTALVLSDYKIKANKDSSKMFISCEEITSISFLNFETSTVENMSSMFYGCKNITTLNLNKFDTSKLSDISNMFYECNLLETVYVSDLWNLDKITTAQENVFYNCEKIVGENGTSFEVTKITSEFACVDKEEKAGYFTYKNEDEIEIVDFDDTNNKNENNQLEDNKIENNQTEDNNTEDNKIEDNKIEDNEIESSKSEDVSLNDQDENENTNLKEEMESKESNENKIESLENSGTDFQEIPENKEKEVKS